MRTHIYLTLKSVVLEIAIVNIAVIELEFTMVMSLVLLPRAQELVP
jgi:hypothetical protein